MLVLKVVFQAGIVTGVAIVIAVKWTFVLSPIVAHISTFRSFPFIGSWQLAVGWLWPFLFISSPFFNWFHFCVECKLYMYLQLRTRCLFAYMPYIYLLFFYLSNSFADVPFFDDIHFVSNLSILSVLPRMCALTTILAHPNPKHGCFTIIVQIIKYVACGGGMKRMMLIVW